ncbi:hypothetical protein GF314_10445 [bacterium]|nr:hypothetical protein [bacterium]
MGEKKQFLALPPLVPGAGDILITKVWRDTDATKTGRRIVAGQALFSRMYRGSMRSEHAAVCSRRGRICEALPDTNGVEEANIDFDESLVVFRSDDLPLRTEIGRVASLLARNTPQSSGVSPAYSEARAKRSVTKMRYLGRGGRRFLTELYVLAYGPENDPVALSLKERMGTQPVIRPTFCSEFACACLELASLKIMGRPCLNVDPRAISPKAFEALLRRSGRFARGRAVYETEAERRAYEDAF